MQTIKVLTPISELQVIWAYVSLITTLIFLLLLILLHFIKSDINPMWHMVSEYGIGRYGWIMQAAFFCLAFSCVSITAAVWLQTPTISGKIGLALMLVTAIGLIIAGFNVTDPINTPKTEMTAQGHMHALGFMIGVPSMTIGVVLISISLRYNPTLAWARQPLIWSAQVPWISIVLMLLTFAILLPKNEGKFGPGVVIGLPNRLWVLGCCIWLLIAASCIIKQNKEELNKKLSDTLVPAGSSVGDPAVR